MSDEQADQKVEDEEKFIRIIFREDGSLDYTASNVNSVHLWAAAQIMLLKGNEVFMMAEMQRQQKANSAMKLAIARSMPGN